VKQTEISRATMGRLPGYLNYLRSLSKETRFISSTAIAKELELGEVQVRKDLSAVCGAGKPKVGYDVSALAESLETTLGTHSKGEAIIVGAGKLGLALLGFGGFSEYGIKISHAFDNDPSKFSASVLPIGELPRYCRQHKIEIGIIAVPSEAAQQTAELLTNNGIKAIWSFSTVRLQVPKNVTVQYENLALSLAHLHQKVKANN